MAQPSAMGGLWSSVRETFKRDIGPAFSGKHDDILAAGFCAITAYDLKPYGASTALELDELLAADAIDCDNYCILAWHLFKQCKPASVVTMKMVGWNGGAVGNHAQLIAEIPGVSAWLLDPTIGLIVGGATFDNICKGVPLTYMTQPAGTRDINYSRTIKSALSLGLYKPSDLMYYFKPETYIQRPPRAHWGTPQA